MNKQEVETARLIFISMMKAISEHHTFLIGEFKMEIKQDVNNIIKSMDRMIRTTEKNLTENQKEYLQSITDVYHNINIEIRKQAVERYESSKVHSVESK
jgi:hypothetical protein